MTTRTPLRPAVAVIAALMAAGCGSASSTAVSHLPTSTQVPATTQTYAKQSPSAEVIAAAIGLTTMPGYVAYTAATDPNHLLGRQGGYTSKVDWGTWSSPQGDIGDGGSIEVFAIAAAAGARARYLQAITPPVGDGYDYVSGTAVLRLRDEYTPAQAAALAAKFAKAAT